MRQLLAFVLGLAALVALALVAIPAADAGDGYTRLAQTCPKGQRYDYRSGACVKD
jgi:hypothetical protein